MNGLHNLVTSGKVLYLVSDSAHNHALEVLTIVVNKGISDTPAWIVAKANLYARLMGKTPFVIYQGAWSILQRDFEREILPMARAEGVCSLMSVRPGGILTRPLLPYRPGSRTMERSCGRPNPNR